MAGSSTQINPNFANDISFIGQVASTNATILATFGYHTGVLPGGDYISNLSDRATALLIEQFQWTFEDDFTKRDRPNIQSLVRSFVDQLQGCENSLQDIALFRSIDTANGSTLDGLGSIVGLLRTSSDDDVYRSDIKFQIYLNVSNGEPETIISALTSIVNAESVSYLENYPAGIILNAVVSSIPPSNLRERLEKIVAAGVKLQLTYNFAGGEPFGFSESNGAPTSGLGFTEYNYPAADINAGRLVEIIT